jgi:hypothetical protein
MKNAGLIARHLHYYDYAFAVSHSCTTTIIPGNLISISSIIDEIKGICRNQPLKMSSLYIPFSEISTYVCTIKSIKAGQKEISSYQNQKTNNNEKNSFIHAHIS